MLDTTLAAPQEHGGLTIFPLIAAEAVDLPYLLLTDALQSGAVQISEIGSGTVPELAAHNAADAAVLVLDGEQLIGARQNRMANRSLLLPAQSKTVIPVSCMEHGRWHLNSDHFAPSTQHSPSTVRRQAREVEAERVAAGVPASPDALASAQGRVWDAIAEQADHVGGHSDTGALDHLYHARAADIDAWLPAFPVLDHQVGLLAFLGTSPLGLDVIGGTNLYRQVHERLVRGYVMDALGRPAPSQRVAPRTAQRFLDQVRTAPRVDAPTVGQGAYAALSGAVIGGELTDGVWVAHLAAFPVLSHGSRGQASTAIQSDPPVMPPSRRRRHRE